MILRIQSCYPFQYVFDTARFLECYNNVNGQYVPYETISINILGF